MIDDGRIAVAGGPEHEAPAVERWIELDGAHVIPGLTDPHSHLSAGAWFPSYEDGSGLADRREAISAVRAATGRGPEGTWVVLAGLDHHSWPEQRLPTRDELDAVCPDRPALLMDVSLHVGSANSAALRASGVAWMPDAHDDVERGRWGQPSGPIWEKAFSRARWAADRALAAAIGDHGVEGLLDAAADHHLSLGIVRVHEPGIAPDTAEALAALRGRRALRLSWSVSPYEGQQEPPSRLADLPPGPYGEGGPQLKIFLDGAHRCALAFPAGRAVAAAGGALRRAWDERSTTPLRSLTEREVRVVGTEVRTPYLRFGDRGLADLVQSCAEEGIGVRFHALGNLAVLQASSVAELTGLPLGGWHAEHVLGLRDADLETIAATRPICSLQPGFIPGYADVIRDSGLMPAIRVLPLRSLLDAGVPVAISSDHPCGPLDPLGNLRLAVTRRLPDGSTLDVREAISRSEAMAAATSGAVRAAGVDTPGVLVEGSPADLAIVDGDPFVAESRVRQTWIDGEAVWTAGTA